MQQHSSQIPHLQCELKVEATTAAEAVDTKAAAAAAAAAAFEDAT